MAKSQLIIPDKLKVGFQERDDTYTKKLAYVVWYDNKGVLRKETSWQSWRNKKINPLDIDNVPTEGFVLNKGVGGVRQSYGYNARNEYVRVYDPRDFEFEISVSNLLMILRDCDCSKGKGLEGNFVYAWNKNNLILLPVNSQEYKESKEFTGLQIKNVSAKSLVAGYSYLTKKQDNLIYLGKFDFFPIYGRYLSYKKSDKDDVKKDDVKKDVVEKRFVFWNGKEFTFLKDTKQLSQITSDVVNQNLAELVQNYYKSAYGSKPVKLFLKEKIEKHGRSWFHEFEPGIFSECTSDYYNNKNLISRIQIGGGFKLENNILKRNANNHLDPIFRSKDAAQKWFSTYYGYGRGYQTNYSLNWIEPSSNELWIELESGSKFKVSSYSTEYRLY